MASAKGARFTVAPQREWLAARQTGRLHCGPLVC